MRMWNVDPKLQCRAHLLGEHRECHALISIILHNKPLSGTKYITTGLVEVHNIKQRHNELVLEMTRRGYNHKSPLPDADLWTEGQVDSAQNLIELRTRCPECAKLQLVNQQP
jgi:hypothetical protein